MIIIPDIHINTKQSVAILAKLEEIFANYPDKEVVFLGDYVYMFSYDRASLIGLFNIFLKLFTEWRVIKVMSGNHDRIAGHFVYDEAKKAFDIMNKYHNQNWGSLEFITQIQFRKDEDNNLHVILPYNDHLEIPDESDYFNSSVLWNSSAVQLMTDIELLKTAKNNNEQFSATLNEIILTIYETNKNNYNHIFLYHHYYTAHTTFPGVQSIFHFKDKAISPFVLDLQWLTLISGHIHEPFVFKNYICVGSFRNTSGGEINEIKWVMIWKPWYRKFLTHRINPKFVLPFGWDKTIHYYTELIQDIIQSCIKRMEWNGLVASDYDMPPSHLIDIILQFDKEVPEPEVLDSIAKHTHTLQAQKQKAKIPQSMTLLEPEDADYVNELQSRKLLLENFLDVKYADQKVALMNFLEQHKLV